MAHRVTLIRGDGIGPEISEAAVRVVAASGAPIEWEEVEAGLRAVERFGTPVPGEVIESIRRNRVALKAPLATPIGGGYRSPNVLLRQTFDLYANVRPALSFKGVPSRYEGVDLVIVRENTEGLYAGIEHFIRAGGEVVAAESVALVTRLGAERIVDFAFRYAREKGRRKVTLVHKANILKCTSGLFLQIGQEVAARYPEIPFEDRLVDACAMQLVLDPGRFDLIVTTNLFGDILSDLAAGLVGGLGLAPAANIGKEVAIFEAVHGTAPDIAGKGIANPTALILAAKMMLEHLGELEAARKIERAVRKVLAEGKRVTPDLNPTSGCSTLEMAEAIVAAME